MKKIIALLLAAIMVLGLAACASKTETKEASDVKNVVYIVNGNLGDKSFFDSAQAGIDELVRRTAASPARPSSSAAPTKTSRSGCPRCTTFPSPASMTSLSAAPTRCPTT